LPLEAYYLNAALPVSPELHRDLLENFLSVQAPDGTVDNKPGIAGQRSKFLCSPLLATMAWHSYEETGDQAFVARVFPKLMAFFHAWFASARDPDGDGIPRWEHILQTGFEDNPLFDMWFPWSQSLEVGSLFSPELEAMLAREASALMCMAEKLGLEGELSELRQLAPRLTSSIAAGWNARASIYSYRDRLTGLPSPGGLLGSLRGPGEVTLKKAGFDKPVRLLIDVQSRSSAARRPHVAITGEGPQPPAQQPTPEGTQAANGQLTEDLHAEFRRHAGGLVAATTHAYTRLARIAVSGLNARERLVVRTVDTSSQDITLFTPLWANVLHPDRAQTIVDRLRKEGDGFNRPFGIPALPASPAPSRAGPKEKAEAEAMAMGVHLPWNQLVGEGLLAYGFRDEAARLTQRLMGAVVLALKQSRAFYERYHAVTGSGLGERGALTGLAPLGLFLETLGVRFLSPTSVKLEGANPFPWPVTIVYRGLKVTRGLQATQVTFPNEQIVTVTDPSPCIVSL
jgi:hypothetical protein